MTSSVRQRIERQQQELEAAPTPTARRVALGANRSMSVRQRQELAAENAEPEKFQSPARHYTGMTATNAHDHIGSVRSRIERQEFEARERAETPTADASLQARVDFYYNEHLKEQAEKRAKEAEQAERQRQQRIAEQAEVQRQAEARIEKAKRFAVDLMFTSAGASLDEIRRITALVNANCPQHRYNHEKQWAMLMQVRSITKPDVPNWAGKMLGGKL